METDMAGQGRRGRSRVVALAVLVALVVVGLWPGQARAERDISRLCPASMAQGTQFRDVAPGSVHARGIYCIAAAGITTGTSPTTYHPDNPVSRGQMAAFLRRLLSGTTKPVPNASQQAPDVAGHTHQAAIDALLAADIIPDGPGPFRPDTSIRRDDMAAWMNGTWEWMTGSRVTAEGQPFGDLAGNPHAADIAGLYVHGVVNGKGSGYDPAGVVNRGQMGSFLARLLSMHADGGHYPDIAAVTTTTVAPTTTTTTTTTTTPPMQNGRDTAAEASLFAHHNNERTSRGLPALARNSCLDNLASEWARGMSTSGQLRHRPDFGSAGTAACLPARRSWYENVGYDSSISGLAAAFMASPSHRENILRAGISQVGIGAWRDNAGQVWVTVNFVG